VRVVESLCRVLEPWLSEVHAATVAATFAGVKAVLVGQELTLSRLGRAMPSPASEKHGIKRADRLLGNARLHGERIVFARAIANYLLPRSRRPLVLIDWTEATTHRHSILVAALAFKGRAIPLYAETYSLSLNNNPRVEQGFLDRLKRVFPDCLKPIIITDAGFRFSWFDHVRKLGWDYVGRIRGGYRVRQGASEPWIRTYELFKRARRTAADLGVWEFTPRRLFSSRIVTVDGRSRRARRPLKNRRRGLGDLKCAKRAREPLLLVSSMTETKPAELVRLYATRMQIEEVFRDAKSYHFGWSLEAARSRVPERIDNLLLLATLAAVAVLAVGLAAEAAGIGRHFQANTLRTRRVMSLFALGRRVILHSLRTQWKNSE
jgi:hypothetical protein